MGNTVAVSNTTLPIMTNHFTSLICLMTIINTNIICNLYL